MSWLSNAFHDITGTTITQAVQAAVPVAAATLGGPAGVGAALGNASLGAALATPALVAGDNPLLSDDPLGQALKNLMATIQRGGVPVGVPSTASLGAAPKVGGVLGSLGSLLGVGGAVAAAAGVIRTVGGRILRFVLPSGMKVSVGGAVQLARRIGIEAAAVALGVGVADVAQAIMQHEKHAHRRGRGITAAQLRTTRRTITKVENAHRQLARLAASAVHHRRAPVVRVIERKR